ncbi:hypothetical protein N7505_007848 [Penicillium chrysogenum]|uniref:Uncharacterized protein n=1 Tax=Penicillium chrysogenum TaxID=5076 RepID=A0ABQ8WEI8_PENCH|nr:hypothetical protein N7505_007848 [Penicillium chrysogenum]
MTDPEKLDAFAYLLEYLGKNSKSSYDFELSFPRPKDGLPRLINRRKRSIESKTGDKWDWWPLSQSDPESKGDHLIVCFAHVWDGYETIITRRIVGKLSNATTRAAGTACENITVLHFTTSYL